MRLHMSMDPLMLDPVFQARLALQQLARARDGVTQMETLLKLATDQLENTDAFRFCTKRREMLKQAKQIADQEYMQAAHWVAEAYAVTKDKHPVPGASIRIARGLEYDTQAVKAWAEKNAPHLICTYLDKDRFEKGVLDGVIAGPDVPSVKLLEVPHAIIASDLSSLLAEENEDEQGHRPVEADPNQPDVGGV